MENSDTLNINLPKQYYITQEGFPFIGIAVFVALFFAIFNMWFFFVFFMGVAAFICFFFRNPNRKIPIDSDVVVSPADGRVIFAGLADDNRHLNRRVQKVCVFMSALNVHVNRMPVSGIVNKVWYNPGKFHLAHVDKAALDNEQNGVFITDEKGRDILFVQIAGWFARRIVCYLEKGVRVNRGDRFGLIRFGSRVDIYLPEDTKLEVKAGDKVSAGSSIIARL